MKTYLPTRDVASSPNLFLLRLNRGRRNDEAPIVTGVSGVNILRGQPFSRMKGFHAGGGATWWLADAQRAGLLDHSGDLLDESLVVPFVELTRMRFDAEQSVKNLIRHLGYYSVFSPSTS